MAECIDRAAAVKVVLRERKPTNSVAQNRMVSIIQHDLLTMRAADVAPVVHGRWDDSGRYTFPGGSTAVRCTNCGCALTVSEYHLNNWNYCPVCGAKMNGGDSDARVGSNDFCSYGERKDGES